MSYLALKLFTNATNKGILEFLTDELCSGEKSSIDETISSWLKEHKNDFNLNDTYKLLRLERTVKRCLGHSECRPSQLISVIGGIFLEMADPSGFSNRNGNISSQSNGEISSEDKNTLTAELGKGFSKANSAEKRDANFLVESYITVKTSQNPKLAQLFERARSLRNLRLQQLFDLIEKASSEKIEILTKLLCTSRLDLDTISPQLFDLIEKYPYEMLVVLTRIISALPEDMTISNWNKLLHSFETNTLNEVEDLDRIICTMPENVLDAKTWIPLLHIFVNHPKQLNELFIAITLILEKVKIFDEFEFLFFRFDHLCQGNKEPEFVIKIKTFLSCTNNEKSFLDYFKILKNQGPTIFTETAKIINAIPENQRTAMTLQPLFNLVKEFPSTIYNVPSEIISDGEDILSLLDFTNRVARFCKRGKRSFASWSSAAKILECISKIQKSEREHIIQLICQQEISIYDCELLITLEVIPRTLRLELLQKTEEATKKQEEFSERTHRILRFLSLFHESHLSDKSFVAFVLKIFEKTPSLFDTNRELYYIPPNKDICSIFEKINLDERADVFLISCGLSSKFYSDDLIRLRLELFESVGNIPKADRRDVLYKCAAYWNALQLSWSYNDPEIIIRSISKIPSDIREFTLTKAYQFKLYSYKHENSCSDMFIDRVIELTPQEVEELVDLSCHNVDIFLNLSKIPSSERKKIAEAMQLIDSIKTKIQFLKICHFRLDCFTPEIIQAAVRFVKVSEGSETLQLDSMRRCEVLNRLELATMIINKRGFNLSQIMDSIDALPKRKRVLILATLNSFGSVWVFGYGSFLHLPSMLSEFSIKEIKMINQNISTFRACEELNSFIKNEYSLEPKTPPDEDLYRIAAALNHQSEIKDTVNILRELLSVDRFFNIRKEKLLNLLNMIREYKERVKDSNSSGEKTTGSLIYNTAMKIKLNTPITHRMSIVRKLFSVREAVDLEKQTSDILNLLCSDEQTT